ncbi:nucleoporin p54 isoform X3 [Diceros bicornis minor]|uniref:Nucleoporin p54 isoform X1 n=1 Tax=Ceratotherium simum simum TaxID=73337 RepID=A0ABM1CUQ9_CERSS|nr:PREDICTED: nucleoporin p54 isoform X1 [Ceratotherium simum simum]XP_058403264.1 nucleoporin p54 isoform X3 [Diceros bicornis minor]
MAFNFGAPSGTSGTAAATAAPAGFGGLETANSTASGFNFGGFGLTANPAVNFNIGNFGVSTTSATPFNFGNSLASAGGFGGFGTTSTTAGSAFSFSAPANTGTTGLFGGTQNKGFGFGTGFGTTTGTSTGLGTGLGSGLGFGGFNTQQQQQTTLGGLFSQPTQAPTQSNQLINTASALSAPTLLGDERDAILAKWNQLQAFWGTGKGYFNNNIPPVEFTQENPFCRFKAVGYSCMPNNKDEDGLVVLVFNKKETDIRSQQQQLVESLHKVLGGNQTLTVNVEGIKTLPDDQTEVVIYVVERSPNGTSRRVPATTLYAHFEQNNIKTQLQQLGVTLSMTRTELSPAQIKQLLQNPPAGVDPIIWEQAKVDNPDSEKLIPVPMVGFKELLRRLKVQDQMTKQHQTRLDIISEDISELQKNQTTTMAKIAQYKRKLMDLSHRTLQVLIKQEIQRKSGYAIQADEEQLRVQLDTIQCELNAPTQFKGRLNELMSQIRMQNHFGAVKSEERYYIDADLLREIKQHLKQQQEGLSHLISIIKDDLEDIKLVEHGLNETIHIRGGVFS